MKALTTAAVVGVGGDVMRGSRLVSLHVLHTGSQENTSGSFTVEPDTTEPTCQTQWKSRRAVICRNGWREERRRMDGGNSREIDDVLEGEMSE